MTFTTFVSLYFGGILLLAFLMFAVPMGMLAFSAFHWFASMFGPVRTTSRPRRPRS